MIEQSTRLWRYTLAHDEQENLIAVRFRRFTGKQLYSVTFADNEPACRDWAQLSKDVFFEKHSEQRRAA